MSKECTYRKVGKVGPNPEEPVAWPLLVRHRSEDQCGKYSCRDRPLERLCVVGSCAGNDYSWGLGWAEPTSMPVLQLSPFSFHPSIPRTIASPSFVRTYRITKRCSFVVSDILMSSITL